VQKLIVGAQGTARRRLLPAAGMIGIDPRKPAVYFAKQAQQFLVVRPVFVIHARHRTAVPAGIHQWTTGADGVAAPGIVRDERICVLIVSWTCSGRTGGATRWSARTGTRGDRPDYRVLDDV